MPLIEDGMNSPRSKLRGIRRIENLCFAGEFGIRQRIDGFTQQAAEYQTRHKELMKRKMQRRKLI